MPGLLDITDDPNTAGLLSLGLRLMSTPGKFGTAFGQAGLGAMGDLQQARQMMEQRKLREQQARMQGLQMQSLEQQLADAQRAREEAQRQAERDDAFRRSIPSPQAQALQSLGADASPTLANAARLPQVDPQQQMLYDAFQARLLKTPEYLSATSPKAPEYKVVGDSLVQIGGGRVSEAFRAAPKSDPAKDLLILDPATGKLVPNQALIDVKKQLVPPGVSVSYGAPVAGVDANNNPVYFQPDKGGGAPAIVPGVKPPPQNRDIKPPAEIQRMNIAIDTMSEMLNDYEGMLKKYSPRDPLVQMSPSIRAEFQSLMKGIQLQFKEVQALGALAGPDLAIMEAAITDPFTFRGAFYGKDGLMGQINQSRRLLAQRKKATSDNVKGPQGGQDPASDNDPLGLRN